ncbi:MAG: ABC transporter permease [Clostridia bacterium]|nr:ABC transporter permease [Clostridia bacterium]
MTKTRTKHVREPLVHLTRRLNVSKPYAWGIRIGAFVLSILACAIVSMILSKNVTFGMFFKYLFKGAFGTTKMTEALIREVAVLLLLALAVTPCFKMRYWNIGGEGQAMMGAFGCALIISYCAGKMSVGGVIVLSFLTAIAFAMAWALIPALFKAKWNTNETLLTLMFNYIAICLGAFLIKKVSPKGTGILNFTTGTLASVGVNDVWLIFAVGVAVTVLMFVYLSYSKHGYEITVVGESPNTARYIGINTKKVIIRTLALCGAMGGLVGFLLVSAKDASFLSDNTAQSTIAGRGFTAVLISWLAQFNPWAMVLTSFLVVFINRGANNVGSYARLGNSYASMMVGIFFFFIIATEFFINFKINFRSRAEIAREPDDLAENPPKAEEQSASLAVAAEEVKPTGEEA